jgi:hypothetical protein
MNTSISDVKNAMNMDTFLDTSLSIPPPKREVEEK